MDGLINAFVLYGQSVLNQKKRHINEWMLKGIKWALHSLTNIRRGSIL